MIDDNAFFHQAALAHNHCSFFRAFGGTCFGEMADSNSFKYSDEKLKELDALHDAQEFISNRDELWIVTCDDDDGTDRTVFHFEDACPLHLGEGNEVCKSFSDVFYKCKSCVSPNCARNYLAQHAYRSANHALTNNDMQASFEAANKAPMFYDRESYGDRSDTRAHHGEIFCKQEMNMASAILRLE